MKVDELTRGDYKLTENLEDEASEHRMGIYPSVHLNSVPDAEGITGSVK